MTQVVTCVADTGRKHYSTLKWVNSIGYTSRILRECKLHAQQISEPQLLGVFSYRIAITLLTLMFVFYTCSYG